MEVVLDENSGGRATGVINVAVEVWSEFKDREVLNMNSSILKYYGDPDPEKAANDLEEFLKSNDGRCSAWSKFFETIHLCNAITEVKSRSLFVNQHANLTPIGISLKPFRVVNGELLSDGDKAPGQGGIPSTNIFNGHCVNTINVPFRCYLLDPSYGNNYLGTDNLSEVTGPELKAIQKWMEASLGTLDFKGGDPDEIIRINYNAASGMSFSGAN